MEWGAGGAPQNLYSQRKSAGVWGKKVPSSPSLCWGYSKCRVIVPPALFDLRWGGQRFIRSLDELTDGWKTTPAGGTHTHTPRLARSFVFMKSISEEGAFKSLPPSSSPPPRRQEGERGGCLRLLSAACLLSQLPFLCLGLTYLSPAPWCVSPLFGGWLWV